MKQKIAVISAKVVINIQLNSIRVFYYVISFALDVKPHQIYPLAQHVLKGILSMVLSAFLIYPVMLTIAASAALLGIL